MSFTYRRSFLHSTLPCGKKKYLWSHEFTEIKIWLAGPDESFTSTQYEIRQNSRIWWHAFGQRL